MNKKVLIISVVAVFSLMVVVAASAAAVFAFTVEEAAPVEVMTLEDAAIEAAPVQAEVAAPVLQAEKANYKSGCSYSHSRLQLTEAPAEQTIDDTPLAQVAVE